LAGVFHANEADVVVKFPADGKRADDFDQLVEHLRGGFLQQVLHVQHQPFLGIQFLILPLYFVKAIGEQHHQITRGEGDFTGLIRRVVEQAERRLAPGGSVDERLDFACGAVEEQWLGMPGVGKTHFAGPPVGHQIKCLGEHWRTGAFKDAAQIGIEFAQKISRLARQWLQFLRQRADHGGDQRGADPVAGHVANEDGSFRVRKRVDVEKIAAMFWVAQASGLSFLASRRKPFATTIIVSTTANPHATFPHEIWRDAKLNRRDACSTQNHTGGVLAQTEA
jgi:hypothetical protein